MPARRASAGRLTIAAILGLAAAVTAALSVAGIPPARGGTPPRPNIVVIQTDDQPLHELYASFVDNQGRRRLAMPNALRRIAAEGISFDRYYVSYPLCCPSRVSLLTGKYAHNHGVLVNFPPHGYPGFRASPGVNHNVAVWLQRAGYRTIHVGKFINFYGEDDPAEIPPGWSSWRTVVGAVASRSYYGYRLNENGAITGPFGAADYSVKDPPGCPGEPPPTCNYVTDVENRIAVEETTAALDADVPFYLQVDYTAPHGDFVSPIGPEPAPRHFHTVHARIPRTESFNEANVGDKPRFIRDTPPLSADAAAALDVWYRRELESLRSVDEGIGMLLDLLEGRGALDHTYVFFTTDNGEFRGEHRLGFEKYLAYEQSSQVPLIVRGPGILPGVHSAELVANVDLAPTFAQIATAAIDSRIDGRPLLPFMSDPDRRTRRPILLEGFDATPGTFGLGGGGPFNAAPARDYRAIVADRFKYIRHPTGEEELYDLVLDPLETRSLARNRRYTPVRRWLVAELNRLIGCAGRSCRLPSRGEPPAPRRADR